MICYKCKTKTKNLRYGQAIPFGDGSGSYTPLLCRVCRRKQDGRRWRIFRLLQIFRLY